MSFEEPSVTDRAVWIGLGVTAVIVAIAAVVFGLYLLGSTDSSTDAACAEGCLDSEDAESLFPSKADLRTIGMLTTVGYEGNPEWDANAYAVRSGTAWQRNDGEPASCEFAAQAGVLGATALSDTEEDDPVFDFGGWYNDYDELSQGVRVLDSEIEAAALLASLDDAIDGCTAYSLKTSVTDVYAPTMARSELAVVASADSVSWIEEVDGYTATIAFVQERNLVSRIIVERYEGSELTNEQVADFVHRTSQRMSELEP